MPIDTIASLGTMMIHSVSARNGSRQTKKLTTTAPSMKITCLRYLYTLPRLPLDALDMMMVGFSIRFFAITEYSTTSMSSGTMKNSTMLPTKKDAGQKLSTGDRQAATMLPSMYSTYSYDEIIRIGLREGGGPESFPAKQTRPGKDLI
uniref:Uncharacterized protein n=1 Tax=Anopheles merus TaxID=30066 RepID=A0A182V3I5_ANOME